MADIRPGPVPQEVSDILAATLDEAYRFFDAMEDLAATTKAAPMSVNPMTVQAALEALSRTARHHMEDVRQTLMAYAGEGRNGECRGEFISNTTEA